MTTMTGPGTATQVYQLYIKASQEQGVTGRGMESDH